MDTSTQQYQNEPAYTSGSYTDEFINPINMDDDNLWIYLSSLEHEGSIVPFADMDNSDTTKTTEQLRKTILEISRPRYATSSSSGTDSPYTPCMETRTPARSNFTKLLNDQDSAEDQAQKTFDAQRDLAFANFARQPLIPLASITKTEKRMTRQAQNRNSQRKFRARQVEKLKILEGQADEMKAWYEEALKSNEYLRSKCSLLEAMVREGNGA